MLVSEKWTPKNVGIGSRIRHWNRHRCRWPDSQRIPVFHHTLCMMVNLLGEIREDSNEIEENWREHEPSNDTLVTAKMKMWEPYYNRHVCPWKEETYKGPDNFEGSRFPVLRFGNHSRRRSITITIPSLRLTLHTTAHAPIVIMKYEFNYLFLFIASLL